MVVGLPLTALLAALAGPTADLPANGELRTGELVAMLGLGLTVIAFAQLVGGVHDLGRQALFARLDDRGPRLAGYLALLGGASVGSAVLLLPPDGARLGGLALAILAAELAAATTVLVRLRRTAMPGGFVDRRLLAVALAGTVATLPLLAGGRWLLADLEPTRLLELGILAGLGALALAEYALVLKLSWAARSP